MEQQKNHFVSSIKWYQELNDVQRELIGETGNHVKRVAEYSYMIALGLGLSSEEAELIKVASPMHDIGKLGIPHSITKKPGKLTPDEYEIIKLHSEIGYGQLKDSSNKILQAAAIIAYEHHEKWNGKGYPRGLIGEEIHIYGRITALADVFDALSSVRVYKKSWDLDRILNFIAEERGEHFDPKVVDVFTELLPDILNIFNENRDEPKKEDPASL